MDYSDVLAQRIDGKLEAKTGRRKVIDAIMKHFDITFDDIKEAEELIDSRIVDDPLQYYFLGSCIREGEELRDIGFMDTDNYYDDVKERAESVVPYQTYVIYRLWVEFGYETEAYEEIGIDSVALNDIESVAQYQLFSYAEKIIFDFGGINKPSNR